MESKMRERLQTIRNRCLYLEKMMELPTVAADYNRYRLYAKEKSNLSAIAALYNDYEAFEKAIEEAKLLTHDKEEEIAELGRAELEENSEKLEALYEKIRQELVPRDPNDLKNVMVEIRGAAGGDEGNIFAGDLFRMYTRFCENKGWQIDILDSSESEAGGFSFVSFIIKGKGAFSYLKYESGAHRVQRVPSTEGSGRIHTSTATVLVMPEADEVDVAINMSEIQIDTYRASGAGGQHVNKTESAIRMTHLPTGIVVTCQDGRSQIENRATALSMIRTKILDARMREAESIRGAERRLKIGTGDRSEKIRTYNYPQNRVTDHRIGFTIQQLDRVMEGQLDSIIQALIDEDQKQKLLGSGI